MADTTLSGFADINYNAFHSDAEEGTFGAAGELDVAAGDDSASVRFDLDIVDVLSTNGASGAAAQTAGVDVEQANVVLKLSDMLGLTAGIANSPFGREGQDATDINFAGNGLLFAQRPHNVAGALASVTLNEQISANVGYINSLSDITGTVNAANDVVVTVAANVVDGVSLNLGYLTDSTDGMNGDMINAYVNLGLVENLDVAVEFLSGDPVNGSGNFDSGYGVVLGYNLGKASVDARYETTTAEGAGSDQTQFSLAGNLHMSDNCVVRADFTSHNIDTPTVLQTANEDTLTVQMVHSF
ncbi:MAG: outer membrane beta-barrel protein [Nitrospirae bacterium]|nr:outer membrane beta-barrel protein [Nitrospirota bacterium]